MRSYEKITALMKITNPFSIPFKTKWKKARKWKWKRKGQGSQIVQTGFIKSTSSVKKTASKKNMRKDIRRGERKKTGENQGSEKM